MKIKELEVVVDDYEHHVNRLIDNHLGDDDFPSMDDYGIDRESLSDYLYDKQAVMDRRGSKRTQLTVAGFMVALPPIVLSAFPEEQLPWGKWSLFVALGMGLALALVVRLLVELVTWMRLRSMRDNSMEAFISKVLDIYGGDK